MHQSVKQSRYYLYLSLTFHVGLLLLFFFNFEFLNTTPVFENSVQKDSISVVILGESPKSKILPQKVLAKITPAKEIKTSAAKKIIAEQDAIPLKINKSKPIAKAEKKVTPKIKLQFKTEHLLADIKKTQEIEKTKLKNDMSKQLKQLSEKTLRDNLLNEEIQLQAQEKKIAAGIVNKYRALILQKISENWIVPPQVNRKLSTELLIELNAQGKVLAVKIMHSSGDIALDTSARAAVLKASPLPLPAEKKLAQPFNTFLLKVRPENIISVS